MIVLATVLVTVNGLPQRSNFTGTFVYSLGWVAPEVGAIAPSFTLTRLDSSPFTLRDHAGQTVIINFWATWCEPCRTEMPELQKLHEQSADEDITIVGINLGESNAQIQSWVDSFGLTFDIVSDMNRNVERLYQVRGQPATYIIGEDGRISAIRYGATNAEELAQLIGQGSIR